MAMKGNLTRLGCKRANWYIFDSTVRHSRQLLSPQGTTVSSGKLRRFDTFQSCSPEDEETLTVLGFEVGSLYSDTLPIVQGQLQNKRHFMHILQPHINAQYILYLVCTNTHCWSICGFFFNFSGFL